MTQITPSVHMNLMKESAGVKGSATNIPISQTKFIFLRRLTLVTAKLKMKKTREQNLKYPKQKRAANYNIYTNLPQPYKNWTKHTVVNKMKD